MKNYFNLVILFLVFNTSIMAASVKLEGRYTCQSIEVGTHQLYTGNVTLRKTGDTYTINSKFNDGSTYQGTGIYDPKNRILAVAAINPENSHETGLSLNKIHQDGSITGKWTYLHRNDISTSRCLKNSNKV